MFLIQRFTNNIAPSRACKAKNPARSNMIITKGLRYARETEAVGTAIVKVNQNGSRS